MGISLFPIGTTASGVDYGTIDDIQYDMFEPNAGCVSHKVHTTLLTTFQDQTMLSRKKAEPYLNITYNYTYIFNREYRQIEHFVDSVDDALTPFFTIDWSQGRTASNVASAAGNWVVSIDRTLDYTATTNMKSNKMFVWNGTSWKMGDVSSTIKNTSVTISISTNNRGGLKHTNISLDKTLVYPVYEVRLTPNALNNFERTVYWKEQVKNDTNGGFMRSGEIAMISRYKV